MINDIEIFREPLKIRENLMEPYGPEMSDWQSAFLCGLVKKYKPSKMVEVGIAAGGTTAVLLNCISMLGLDTELYSIDLNKNYYRDESKETGYLAKLCKKFLPREVLHKMYCGGILPEYADEIGDGIDFLILDTTHNMPGEILDFLVSLPLLKNGAIVVLHDIIMNHLHKCHAEAFVTKLLLSTVVGEKILCKEDCNPYEYPNIGAFIVTDDTRKYIEDVFLSLTITWSYMPEERHLDLYRKWFCRFYSERLCEEFKSAIDLNRDSMVYRKAYLYKGRHDVKDFIENIRNKQNIWIYGCGAIGRKIYSMLSSLRINVEGYVISDGLMKPVIEERVEYISDSNFAHDF